MSPVLLVVATAAPVVVIAAMLPRYAPRSMSPGRPPRTWLGTSAGRTAPVAHLARVAHAVAGRIVGRRRQRDVDAALPDAIELLVLAVHAGATPARAVHDVQPLVAPVVRPAFDTVVHRLQRGQRLADAVAAIPEQLGPRAGALADGIAAADRYGLPLGPVLDALATEARADRRRIGEARARSLSVKLSFPLVVCTLPAFVLVAIVPAVLGSLASLPTSPIA